MSSSLSIRRPFAAATAFAVLVGGLVLAPVVASPALASDASDTTSLVTQLNGGRELPLQTSPVFNRYVKAAAAAYAKRPTTWTLNTETTPLPVEIDGGAAPVSYEVIAVNVLKAAKPTVGKLYTKLTAVLDEEENSIVLNSAYDFGAVSIVTTTKGKYAVAVVADYSSAPAEVITTGTVKISGTAAVGNPLKAVLSGWKADGVALTAEDFTYSWIVAGEERGNQATFPVILDALGKTVTLKVSAAKDGYLDSAVKTSAATKKTVKGTFSVSAPVASGNRNVGEWLDAAELFEWKVWPVVETGPAFQWYRGTTKIEGAIDNDYYQLPTDKGKKISVVITIAGEGYNTYRKQSSTKLVTAAPLLHNTYQPFITYPNSEEVNLVGGTVLTAETGGDWTAESEGVEAVAGVAYSYQWYINTTAVKGATKASYTAPDSAANKSIKVVITGTFPGYAPTKRSSEPVFVGYKNWTSLPDGIAVSGSFVKGKKLTASVPVTDPSGATVKYQWFGGDDKAIKGQTSRTHVVTAKDIAAGFVQIQVIVSKPGYESQYIYGGTGLG